MLAGRSRASSAPDLDARLASQVLYGALEQMLTVWVFERPPAGEDEIVAAERGVTALLCDGLAVRARSYLRLTRQSSRRNSADSCGVVYLVSRLIRQSNREWFAIPYPSVTSPRVLVSRSLPLENWSAHAKALAAPRSLAAATLVVAGVDAATPAGGTVSGGSTTANWTGGPFLTSNPNPAGLCLGGDPACDATA